MSEDLKFGDRVEIRSYSWNGEVAVISDECSPGTFLSYEGSQPHGTKTAIVRYDDQRNIQQVDSALVTKEA